MIKDKKDLKNWLEYEAKNYQIKGMKMKIFPINEHDTIWKFQCLLRKTEYYTNTNKKIRKNIYKFFLYKMSHKYGLLIPINTCDKGLRIMHLGPVLIANTAKIGKDCAIHMYTAVASSGTNGDSPKLGNGVLISVGAKVIGGVKIADDIVIGANAVVNKSFLEKDIAIAGVPAKKISDNGRSTYRK